MFDRLNNIKIARFYTHLSTFILINIQQNAILDFYPEGIKYEVLQIWKSEGIVIQSVLLDFALSSADQQTRIALNLIKSSQAYALTAFQVHNLDLNSIFSNQMTTC